MKGLWRRLVGLFFEQSFESLSSRDEGRYKEMARTRSVQFYKGVTFAFCALVLLWWPVDLFAFQDPIGPWRASLWRFGFLFICVVSWWLLSISTFCHRHSLSFILFFVSLLSVWVGATVPNIALSGPQPPLGHLLPLGSLFLLWPLRHRILATLIFGSVLPITFFVSHIQRFQCKDIFYFWSLHIVPVCVSILVGRLFYRLTQDNFAQRALLLGRASELEDVNGQLKETTKRLHQRVDDAHRSLQRFATEAEKAKEGEREHIAQDLHDQLGQLLTGMRFELDLARLRVEEPAMLATSFNELDGLLSEVMDTLREILQGLRPRIVSQSGLVAACRWLVQSIERRATLEIELTIQPASIELSEAHASSLFRVLQEGLTNVLKHAQAKHVQISLVQDEQTLRVCIQDDGVGFRPEKAHTVGLGLPGIRSRVALMNGTFDVASQPGEGTCLTLSIPRHQ